MEPNLGWVVGRMGGLYEYVLRRERAGKENEASIHVYATKSISFLKQMSLQSPLPQKYKLSRRPAFSKPFPPGQGTKHDIKSTKSLGRKELQPPWRDSFSVSYSFEDWGIFIGLTHK